MPTETGNTESVLVRHYCPDTESEARRGKWLRLTQGHTGDRAKLASILHACSVFLAAVTRMKMPGLSPPSAIPPRLSSLLATLGDGVHTLASVLSRVPNECRNHICGRQRNHIHGLSERFLTTTLLLVQLNHVSFREEKMGSEDR